MGAGTADLEIDTDVLCEAGASLRIVASEFDHDLVNIQSLAQTAVRVGDAFERLETELAAALKGES